MENQPNQSPGIHIVIREAKNGFTIQDSGEYGMDMYVAVNQTGAVDVVVRLLNEKSNPQEKASGGDKLPA